MNVYVWPISYSFNHGYNYRSYLSIYTALVKRNHSVTMVLPMVERLRNWPVIRSTANPAYVLIVSLAVVDCGKDLCTADIVVATPNIIITGRILRYLNKYLYIETS